MKEAHIEEASNGFVCRIEEDDPDEGMAIDIYIFSKVDDVVNWLKQALTAPMIGKAK